MPGSSAATGRGVCAGVQPLCCHRCVLLLAATGHGSRDEKLCVRTQVSDMQALLGLKAVRYLHQNAVVAGSVVIDPVLGSCFS